MGCALLFVLPVSALFPLFSFPATSPASPFPGFPFPSFPFSSSDEASDGLGDSSPFVGGFTLTKGGGATAASELSGKRTALAEKKSTVAGSRNNSTTIIIVTIILPRSVSLYPLNKIHSLLSSQTLLHYDSFGGGHSFHLTATSDV